MREENLDTQIDLKKDVFEINVYLNLFFLNPLFKKKVTLKLIYHFSSHE